MSRWGSSARTGGPSQISCHQVGGQNPTTARIQRTRCCRWPPGIVLSPEQEVSWRPARRHPFGPPDRQPVASRAAHEILDRLLSPPQVELLNLWLVAAVQHGQRASSSYWTPLAMVAARTTAVDQAALARAIGERGVWFVAQNPQWTRLASSLRSDLHDDLLQDPSAPSVAVTDDEVIADPQLILRAATPWPRQLSETFLKIIGSGRLREHRSRYAATVGLRLPLEHYELLRSAVQQRPAPEEALTPLALRSVREAYRTLERIVWVRIEIQSAFAGEPLAVQRLQIPPW